MCSASPGRAAVASVGIPGAVDWEPLGSSTEAIGLRTRDAGPASQEGRAQGIPVMSMYLSNSDLQPTGFEPGEFIDIPIKESDPWRLEADNPPPPTSAACPPPPGPTPAAPTPRRSSSSAAAG